MDILLADDCARTIPPRRQLLLSKKLSNVIDEALAAGIGPPAYLRMAVSPSAPPAEPLPRTDSP
jgi:hypothetical protein